MKDSELLEIKNLVIALGERVELSELQIIRRIGNLEIVNLSELIRSLDALVVELRKEGERATPLLEEILRKEDIMATQADVDAVSGQLDGLKTAVAKIGSDLTAFIASAGASITLEALQTKVTEVASALQAVDDLVPEQPTP